MRRLLLAMIVVLLVPTLARACSCSQVPVHMVMGFGESLDVGGQSTRPGSTRVPEQEEAARVVPLIRCGRAGSAGLYILGTGSSQGAESPYPRTL